MIFRRVSRVSHTRRLKTTEQPRQGVRISRLIYEIQKQFSLVETLVCFTLFRQRATHRSTSKDFSFDSVVNLLIHRRDSSSPNVDESRGLTPPDWSGSRSADDSGFRPCRVSGADVIAATFVFDFSFVLQVYTSHRFRLLR